MYEITQPPVYDIEASYSTKSWLQRVFRRFLTDSKGINITSAYTIPADIFAVRVNATGGAVTVTLPTAVENEGRKIFVKKTDASGNAVTVDGNGSETIDGAANVSLPAQYDAVFIYCNGVSWDIISTV